MDKIQCGTSGCSNAITHYHKTQERYYCEHCVLVVCNTKECKALGSVRAANILTSFLQDILDEIRDYVSSQKLEKIWRLALDQLKQFEADLSNIKTDLKNTIDAENPKDLKQIKQRGLDLKEQIKNSEVFSKYLVHKELARLRFRDANKDNDLLICKTVRVISELKTEEEKIMIRNRLDKISHLLVPEPAVNKELEDFKLKHDEEINELKSKHMEDEAKYEKEKEDLMNQRIEIEQELKNLNDQYTVPNEDKKLISYEVNLNFYYKQID